MNRKELKRIITMILFNKLMEERYRAQPRDVLTEKVEHLKKKFKYALGVIIFLFIALLVSIILNAIYIPTKVSY
jgi:hypothetical protein